MSEGQCSSTRTYDVPQRDLSFAKLREARGEELGATAEHDHFGDLGALVASSLLDKKFVQLERELTFARPAGDNLLRPHCRCAGQ